MAAVAAVETVERSPILQQLNQFGLHPLSQVFASGKERRPILDVVEKFAWTVPVRMTFRSLPDVGARRTG